MDADYLLDIQLDAFDLLSQFINNTPDAISQKLVNQLSQQIGCNPKYAYTLLLAAACGLDTNGNPRHRDIFQMVFLPAVHLLDVREYQENRYYSDIVFSHKAQNRWQLCQMHYKPFEAFVCNDIETTAEGLQIPQIGVFAEQFAFPAVMQDQRIWMTVTPNEVETMKTPLMHATGNVLTYGLGLGYFAYMASLKPDVQSVTIVERDKDIIQLFKTCILPQFAEKQKIAIIADDAFHHAAHVLPSGNYNYVFADLWHDVSDGLPMYLKLKELEHLSQNVKFDYWIEKSIKCYL